MTKRRIDSRKPERVRSIIVFLKSTSRLRRNRIEIFPESLSGTLSKSVLFPQMPRRVKEGSNRVNESL
ncbi:hypothetical protein LEP1GSC161_4209 [Leptospira santarosai str. CBC1416]|uniref:Uncharacterized protein n=1 Tax=Leptospira santarosai str. CBC1416 TaxID=1193059 RepID=M6VMT7_9LEPT|nr:hypothetical protein LEP1GSC161_4209 [Leptospira santarosai str. CBC1416]